MRRPQEVDRPRRAELARHYGQLLREQEASGLSMTAFAERVGVSACTLYLWRRRLEQQEGEAPRSSAAGQLVEVVVQGDRPPAAPGSGFVLRLESGVRVEVGADFDPAVLRRLLQALGAC